MHRKILRLYSNLGILWNLHLTFCWIIISLKSFRWYIFTNNLIHSGTAEGSGGERKYSKIKLIHFADAKNYNNAFLSFLMLKSWPQSCFFPLSFGHYFQTRYVLFWGSSFQWSWWRPKSCCMKSRLKWNARWSWEKSQVSLDLQRNSIEVGGPPGVGQGQLGEQGSEPGGAG